MNQSTELQPSSEPDRNKDGSQRGMGEPEFLTKDHHEGTKDTKKKDVLIVRKIGLRTR